MAEQLTPVKGYPHFSFESEDFDKEITELSTTLTEEESASKYAKYFNEGIPEIPEEVKKCYAPGQAMDASNGFLPNEAGPILYTPEWKYGTGYCILPNGIAQCFITTLFEGVDAEAFKCFFTHFNPPGDLWYKSWCPGWHVRHYNDIAVENVGLGDMSKVHFLRIIPPEETGLKQPLEEAAPDALLTLIADSAIYPTKDAKSHSEKYGMPQVEMAYFRETPKGVEVRMIFWCGCHLWNGQVIQYRTASEEYACAIAEHVVFEGYSMWRNIREFYEDWKNGYYDEK